jgi:hypothetical protein
MNDQPRPTGPEQDNIRWLRGLRDLAQTWLEEPPELYPAPTDAYVDLYFAFGLACVGDRDSSGELLERARETLAGTKKEVHALLLSGYEYRVTQALEGKPHGGPLPHLLAERLRAMAMPPELRDRPATMALPPDFLYRLETAGVLYAVDRLRQRSRILEPDQRVNPYRHWGQQTASERELALLPDITAPEELATRIRGLLDCPARDKGDEFGPLGALTEGLNQAPRVGREFARELLQRVPALYDALPDTDKKHRASAKFPLLERAFFTAARCGCRDQMPPLVARFRRLLGTERQPWVEHAVHWVVAPCLHALRKLGMRDELAQAVTQVAEWVASGVAPAPESARALYELTNLQMLLSVAGGWSSLHHQSRADPILEAAHSLLVGGKLHCRAQSDLAGEYARALSELPVAEARRRLEDLFTFIKVVRDTYSSAKYFSLSHLVVVEAAVLSAVEVLTRSDEPLTVTT